MLDKIPDYEFYAKKSLPSNVFQPWFGIKEFREALSLVADRTLVSADRLWVLWHLATQASRFDRSEEQKSAVEFWEMGVYKGGTARMLAQVAQSSGIPMRLFDTFSGMPPTDPEKDIHAAGDFNDTSLGAVRDFVGTYPHYHKGFMPDTFRGLESTRIAFAHIDVDIYQSVLDCCEFCYPRMARGGFMVFDDYGFPTCPGARKAVDQFFQLKPEVPLYIPTGQAIVFIS
jgi:O-methyltransferase